MAKNNTDNMFDEIWKVIDKYSDMVIKFVIKYTEMFGEWLSKIF